MDAASLQLEPRADQVLALHGGLTFANAASALQTIDRAVAGGKVRQLDLAGLANCDSAGLACMLAVLAQASQRGQRLELRHTPAGLQALAQVCEVQSLLA